MAPIQKLILYKIYSYSSNCPKNAPTEVNVWRTPNIFSVPTFFQNIPVLYLKPLGWPPYKIFIFFKYCSNKLAPTAPIVLPRWVKYMTDPQYFFPPYILSEYTYTLSISSKEAPIQKLFRSLNHKSTWANIFVWEPPSKKGSPELFIFQKKF